MNVPEPIDDPLWDLMLSTHGCDPSCGCDADFHIDPRGIGGWIDDFGEEFARLALRQVDDLLARGRRIEDAVSGQRGRRFCPPETVTEWLLRWRDATDQALREFLEEEVPAVADAEAACDAARAAIYPAHRRWVDREQRAMQAAGQDPSWSAAEKVHQHASRRLFKAKRTAKPETLAELNAALASAREVMDPIEEACRARDPEHAAAALGLREAESTLREAEQRLRRAIGRSFGSRNPPQSPPDPPPERDGRET